MTDEDQYPFFLSSCDGETIICHTPLLINYYHLDLMNLLSYCIEGQRAIDRIIRGVAREGPAKIIKPKNNPRASF